MATQTITARVDSNVVDYVKRIAEMNGISMSTIINLKLREFMDNKELHLVDCEEGHFYFGEEGIDPKVILDHFDKK